MAINIYNNPTYTLTCDRCEYIADEEGDGTILFDNENQAREWATSFGWATDSPKDGETFLCVGCKEEDDEQSASTA